MGTPSPSTLTGAGTACFICGSHSFGKLFVKGGRSFLECHGCRLVRVSPLPVAGEIKDYYEAIYQRPNGLGALLASAEDMTRITARQRLSLLTRYATGGRLLDVGCSTGVFVEEARRAGFDGTGIELSESAVRQAQSRARPVRSGRAEEIKETAHYEVVTAFDLIEHLVDPPALLEVTRGALKPGGILALTTPDRASIFQRVMRKRWFFYLPAHHFHCFDRRNIVQFLNRCGFQVKQVQRAYKTLTWKYALRQFKAYNPGIYRLAKTGTSFFPAALTSHPFSLYIGEMMVIASRVG